VDKAAGEAMVRLAGSTVFTSLLVVEASTGTKQPFILVAIRETVSAVPHTASILLDVVFFFFIIIYLPTTGAIFVSITIRKNM
jgi:hypothetical protein